MNRYNRQLYRAEDKIRILEEVQKKLCRFTETQKDEKMFFKKVRALGQGGKVGKCCACFLL